MNVITDKEQNQFLNQVILEIRHLYRQDEKISEGSGTNVQVLDINRNQVTFISNINYSVGYYFETKLSLGQEESFTTVIRILSLIENVDKDNRMVAEFVGLDPFLADKISSYRRRLIEKNKQE